jgi:RNA polymerase sigma-70 factor (ECF subfamily)
LAVESDAADRDTENRPSDDEVARLRAAMERAVRRVCPRWLADRADDLVQMATLRVLEARPSAEGNRGVSAFYLHRVAYTTLVDEIRRRKRRPEAPLDEEDDARPIRAAAPGPERTYAAREIGEAIRDCLRHLVRDRRLALALYLEGHTVPQAAALLDWSAKRTENLVYRGLADLRRCLSEKGFAP